MGFTAAIRTALTEKYATFAGRAPRSEFWWFFLFYFLVFFVLGLLLVAVAGLQGAESGDIPVLGIVLLALMGIFVIGTFIPLISVTVRRLHDRNMSGWWYLGSILVGMIPFIGAIGSIALLVVCALRGTQGPNRFGPDPLVTYSPEVFR